MLRRFSEINPLVLAVAGVVLLVVGLTRPPELDHDTERIGPSREPQFLRTEPLAIVTGKATIHLEVEVADTEETRRRGLMFRTELGEDSGMLFDLESEGPIDMWMRNTSLSLDIVFIRADGRIANIVKDAVPFSEARVPSSGPVLAVLELPAGTTNRLGISPGDWVQHRVFWNND